jgi:hypothetical protein
LRARDRASGGLAINWLLRPAPYAYFPYERAEGFARLNPPAVPPLAEFAA